MEGQAPSCLLDAGAAASGLVLCLKQPQTLVSDQQALPRRHTLQWLASVSLAKLAYTSLRGVVVP